MPLRFAAATNVHAGVSLFELLQLLELWTPQLAFAKVAGACTTLHQSTSVPLTGWELGVPLLLRRFADVVGSTNLIGALEALEGPYRSQYRVISECFSLGSLRRHKSVVGSKCMQCASILHLRSACLACGNSSYCKKLRSVLASSWPKNYSFPARSPYTLVRPDLRLMEAARQKAITDGIIYLSKCGSDKKVFDKFGGDIIFLFRNLVHSAGGNAIQSYNFTLHDGTQISLSIAGYLHVLIKRWIEQHAHLSSEVEMEKILNAVEAIHVLTQLNIDDADSIPSPKEMMIKLTQINHPIAKTTLPLRQLQRFGY